jgi:hypothetical protein
MHSPLASPHQLEAPPAQSGGYGGPPMSQIMAMKNDGVPGNYQAR